MKPRYTFRCDFGINEVLSLLEAVKYADRTAESYRYLPQKQTLHKLERETERIWKEYLSWKHDHRGRSHAQRRRDARVQAREPAERFEARAEGPVPQASDCDHVE